MMTQRLEFLKTLLYRKALQPRAETEDARRRELILNILLVGLSLVALIALATSVVYHLIIGGLLTHTDSLPMNAGFLAIVVALWYLSRRGWYRIGVYALLALIWLAAMSLALGWSVELPGAELSFVLGIVMAGVLISGRGGLVVAGVTAVVVVGLGNLQATHVLTPNLIWLRQPVHTGDAIGYAVILLIIGLVSWLANHEIDRSLKRARRSEATLKHERDNLEVRVAERTRMLEQAQLERMLELQRFAEFGRFSAGLLHDLANPLTAASLNLEQLGEGQRSKLLQAATRSLRYLERYIEAARKQLQSESEIKGFTATTELLQVVNILAHKAKAAEVKVTVARSGTQRLHGDPVKFSQLAANLIANAIEAYPEVAVASGKRKVVVELTREDDAVVLSVQDWGVGVDRTDIPDIFSPFYTTKHTRGRNIGIGLAMVKKIVDDDFRGSITVTSTPAAGTRFMVRLHNGATPRPH